MKVENTLKLNEASDNAPDRVKQRDAPSWHWVNLTDPVPSTSAGTDSEGVSSPSDVETIVDDDDARSISPGQ